MNAKRTTHQLALADRLKKIQEKKDLFLVLKDVVEFSFRSTTTNFKDVHIFEFDVKSSPFGTFEIDIKNISNERITLTSCLLLENIKEISLTDKHGCTLDEPKELVILPGESYSVTVKCNLSPKAVRAVNQGLFFDFRTSDGNLRLVRRDLRCVISNELTDSLKPESPFQKRTTEEPVRYKQTLSGESFQYPKNLNELNQSRDLPNNSPSEELRQALRSGGFAKSSKTSFVKKARKVLEEPVNVKNYGKKFKLLLQIEERQAECAMHAYDLRGVTLKKTPARFELQVPGLAERRPSVSLGDAVYVVFLKPDGKPDEAVKYKGFVHEVRSVSVLISLHPRFVAKFEKSLKFNVNFAFNRYPFRIQHRAVEGLSKQRYAHCLFPNHVADLSGKADLRMHNKDLEKNPEQMKAVRSILRGKTKSPYVIFGPPGTGKTVTVVEAVYQILIHKPSCHILVCSPSNSACDLVLLKLLENYPVKKNQIFRLYARSRMEQDIPKKIMSVCNLKERGRGKSIYFPKKNVLEKYRIIATTLITAGRLSGANFGQNHFDFVFVDEASNALESELMVAVENLLSANGRLVVAGDPYQLGPIVLSSLAKHYGLGVSYLERLMGIKTDQENVNVKGVERKQAGHARSIYERGTDREYDSRVITKLVKNYRSHEAIIRLPNQLFYDGELLPCGKKEITESFCSWKHLPKKGFPIVFHGVKGQDVREGNSPSFFNAEEISVVCDYLRWLLPTDLVSPERKGQGKDTAQITKAMKDLVLLDVSDSSRGKRSKKKGNSAQDLEPRHVQVLPEEIGIISPYRKQVKKISKAMEIEKIRGRDKITVGSVEVFQGQERKVIIVSTVRSGSDPLRSLYDAKFHLGFLENPKRFNVALTRAQALLIVVGNPSVLCTDPHWKRFLDYCMEEGGVAGEFYDASDLNPGDFGDADESTKDASLDAVGP